MGRDNAGAESPLGPNLGAGLTAAGDPKVEKAAVASGIVLVTPLGVRGGWARARSGPRCDVPEPSPCQPVGQGNDIKSCSFCH